MGPVQVVVVGFERPAFSGEVLVEFARLRDAGIVRLVDLLLVTRDPDGRLETVSAPPELGAEAGGVAAVLLGRPDGAAGDEPTATDGDPTAVSATTAGDPAAVPAWSLADAVPPGSAAAVALIEHLWAAPLRSAIQRAGGRPLDETWLAPDDVARLDSLLTG